MADITEIRELAKKLNLWNIARGYIDLNDEKLSNLDYLQMILQKELEIRARQKQIKLRRASKLPNKVFDASNLNKGLEWQIKQLSHLTWLNEEQNLILLGKCGTGKTGLAAQLEKLQSAMDIKPIMCLLIILSQWQKRKPQIQKQKQSFLICRNVT